MRSYFNEGEIAEFKRLMPRDLFADWSVLKDISDPLLLTALVSDKPTGSSHWVWPFIKLAARERKHLSGVMRKAMLQDFPEFPLEKLELPKDMRAPFCDRYEQGGNAPAKRPMRFYAWFSASGDKLEFNQPGYPVGALQEYDFSMAVWFV